MNLQELGLTNKYLTRTSLANGINASVYGLRKESVRESFADFKSAEHRMERMSTIKGVKFVNDSKATNVNSAWFALEETVGPIIWIAGGIDKGNDYDPIKLLVRKKVKAIVAIGACNDPLQKAFHPLVMVNMTNMQSGWLLRWLCQVIRFCFRLHAHHSTCLRTMRIGGKNLKLRYGNCKKYQIPCYQSGDDFRPWHRDEIHLSVLHQSAFGMGLPLSVRQK